MEQDNIKAPVEQAEKASGETEKKDHVAYESYQKVLKEKKSFQSRLSEYEAKLQQLQEEKLSAEGKKDELIDTYRSQLNDYKSKLDSTQKTYAWNTLTGEIKREAMKHGCTDPDKLIRLMDDNDLKSIEIGEDFSINTESLKTVIEKNKQENFFLFKNTPKVSANGNPSTKQVVENDKNDLSKLSMEEIRELYKKQYK